MLATFFFFLSFLDSRYGWKYPWQTRQFGTLSKARPTPLAAQYIVLSTMVGCVPQNSLTEGAYLRSWLLLNIRV
jgi:hypothetical protein